MALKIVFSVAVLILASQLVDSAPADLGASVSRDMNRRVEQPRQPLQQTQQQPQQPQQPSPTQQLGAPSAQPAAPANGTAPAPAPQPQAAAPQQPAPAAPAAAEASQQPQGPQQATNDIPRSKRQAGIPPVCCTKDPCDPCATTPCIACPLCG